MNYLYTIVSISFSFLYIVFFIINLHNCSSEKFQIKDFESKAILGFAGPPFEEEKEPLEYFYVKVQGKANRQALELKSGGMMHNTCTGSVLENAKEILLNELTLFARKNNLDLKKDEFPELKKKIETVYDIQLTEIHFKECKPTGKPSPGIL